MRKAIVILALSLLAGCVTAPPKNVNNICSIFKQYPKWYWATQDVQKKWGVPIAVQMAIVHQESKFCAKAKPKRTRLLWVIPWKRPSSAYGYTQALDQTWSNYQKKSGNCHASRNNFRDAVDFVGWYGYTAHCKLGIPRNNAFALYLAYHEGLGGYKKKTYRKKRWLVRVAHKVSRRAKIYQRQLNRCRSQLKQKHWWNFW